MRPSLTHPCRDLSAWLAALTALALLTTMLLGSTAAAETGRIAVAGSMRYAMEALLERFHEEQQEHRLEASYASSGKLRAQIENGAPFDLFFSADMARPEALVRAGHAASEVRHYASGSLVLWTREGTERLHLDELADEEIRRIAIAHPDHAPYGARAIDALRSAGLLAAVEDRLVTGSTVNRALQQAQSGAAEAALISLSLAVHPEVAEQGQSTRIDPEHYESIKHGYILTRHGAENEAAARFAEFITSAPAQEILRDNGFQPPN
ncbi:MAG: molybdate ABC transporter substrate-binding protein [Halorhodospira sp.]